MTPAAIPAVYPSLPDSGRWPDGWQCAAGRRRSFGWCRRPPRSSLRRRRGATVVGTARRGGPTACRCTICGGRNCGVDLSVENVDRPRPDQQRRSGLPAGVPSTSSTGHPRGACRDKAQRRGLRQDTILVCLTPRPSDTAHCARLVTRALVQYGRRPSHLGAAFICSFPAPCRTGIPPWRIEIWQQSGLCHRT